MPTMSKGEEAFALHCRVEKLSPEREYVFAKPRRWRFDYAFPDAMVAVEIEGGTWTNGRHSRGSGMAADMAKYNTAARLGWKVFRYTTAMVMNGTAIDEVKKVLIVETPGPITNAAYSRAFGVSERTIGRVGGATKLRSLEPYVRNLLLKRGE